VAALANARGHRVGLWHPSATLHELHGNPNAAQQAPDPAALRRLTPEAIYAALTKGTMRVQGQGLTDEEKRRVAEWLGGRPLGSLLAGDAKSMENHCPTNPSLTDPSLGPAWNGWGVDVANTRFQATSSAGLKADQVPRLKLKWAFGYPNGVTAAGQPAIASGRIFVGTDIGYVYSLDAATGCIYWSFQAEAGVRNAISIGPVTRKGQLGYAVYFGDAKANVYAVDASDGSLLWTRRVEDHFTARITGAPSFMRNDYMFPSPPPRNGPPVGWRLADENTLEFIVDFDLNTRSRQPR
jgi:polyvinyl alcohol dehydrogenase (cytochrome)